MHCWQRETVGPANCLPIVRGLARIDCFPVMPSKSDAPVLLEHFTITELNLHAVAGMEHVEDIVAIIFACIKLVSKHDGVTADR